MFEGFWRQSCTLESTAKQNKQKKETHDFDCTKYIKYYSPKAQLHALYHKQHKKVSSFAFELCTCLPRNRVTYVCMCACVVLRLLSTGWKASPVDAFGEGQDDAVLRPTNDERALLTPSELHQTFSFTGGQASLLLLPLCPGDLRLDPGQKKQPSHTIWPVTYSSLGCAYPNLLVLHSSFLRKITEAMIRVNGIGLKDGRLAPNGSQTCY